MDAIWSLVVQKVLARGGALIDAEGQRVARRLENELRNARGN
jgi:hypothetical protein